jgi:hypothetical protein
MSTEVRSVKPRGIRDPVASRAAATRVKRHPGVQIGLVGKADRLPDPEFDDAARHVDGAGMPVGDCIFLPHVDPLADIVAAKGRLELVRLDRPDPLLG